MRRKPVEFLKHLPVVGGAVLFGVVLFRWPLATYLGIAIILTAAFVFVVLPEIVDSQRAKRRRGLGCCPRCGADIRDEPWKRAGRYDVRRCPVCSRVVELRDEHPAPATSPAEVPPREPEENLLRDD